MSTVAEPDAVPDEDNLACPVCDYSLRGLPEPRCPECGYTFDWDELRKRARLRQSWFYEHAETFRSHWKTRWRSLWPRSFWAEIGAYTFANPRRLRRYQWATLLLLLLSVLPFGLPAAIDATRFSLPRGRFVTATTLPASGNYHVISQLMVTPSGTNYVSPPRTPSGTAIASPHALGYQIYLPPPRWAEWIAGMTNGRWIQINKTLGCVAIGFGIALPLVLRLYWMLLRASVLHAGVKQVHLTRVTAYTVDALPLLMLIGALVGSLIMVRTSFRPWMFSGSFGWSVMHVLLLPSVVVGAFTWRLSSALRRYVRFPHARPVAWAFGVIVWLGWVVAAINASLL